MRKFHFTPFWFSIIMETAFEWLELKIAQRSFNVDMRRKNNARRKLLKQSISNTEIKIKEQFADVETNVLVRKVS